MPRYKRLTKAPVDPYRAAPLPVDRPAAVYYRQSSEAQIGNCTSSKVFGHKRLFAKGDFVYIFTPQ